MKMLTVSAFFLVASLLPEPAIATPTEAAVTIPHKRESRQVRQIRRAIRQEIRRNDLRAVIVRVSVRGRPLLVQATGDSMTGVRATPRMHFRNGAVAIAYLGVVLLQLSDEGVVSLDDPVSKWLPQLPDASLVTLRMLINCTSGYADYVPLKTFQSVFYADPFRAFTPWDLIDYGISQPMHFTPGNGWSYAHTNFVILGQVLERATGQPLATLIRQRILQPLRLRGTRSNDNARIPSPTLHVFSRERGTYEESTYWNPSWTLASGAIMTTTIADMERSARAIGRGTLLSPASFREMTSPEATIHYPPWNQNSYYGLGIVCTFGWLLQNPQFAGCAGVMAYLPARDISIAVVSTKGEKTDIDTNFSQVIFRRIARILAPANVPR